MTVRTLLMSAVLTGLSAAAFEWVEPEGDFLARVGHFLKRVAIGPGGERELSEIRCARSAAIARALGMSEATAHARHVLQPVPVFRELAEDAANHHERVDGRGCFRGWSGEQR